MPTGPWSHSGFQLMEGVMDQAIVIVPGIGNSGPDHWQSYWETAFPGAARIAPASWEAPDLADWTAALDTAVANAGASPLVICHSLGCLLFAHWRAGSARAVRGAFLVAVPEIRQRHVFRLPPPRSRTCRAIGSGACRCWRSRARTTRTIRRGERSNGPRNTGRRRFCSAHAAI